MPFPLLAGLAGSLGSSLIGGLFGHSAQSAANKANIQMNKENRQWMEKMSNTEWQRGVQDMKAAGMNPMLAFSQGGASSPSNSAPTVIPEDAMARAVSSAGSNAIQAAQGIANIKLTEAQKEKTLAEAESARQFSASSWTRYNSEITRIEEEIKNLKSTRGLTEAQHKQVTDMLPELIALTRAQTGAATAAGQQSGALAELSRLQKPEMQAQAELWKALNEKGKAAGWGMGLIRDLFTIINSVRR